MTEVSLWRLFLVLRISELWSATRRLDIRRACLSRQSGGIDLITGELFSRAEGITGIVRPVTRSNRPTLFVAVTETPDFISAVAQFRSGTSRHQRGPQLVEIRASPVPEYQLGTQLLFFLPCFLTLKPRGTSARRGEREGGREEGRGAERSSREKLPVGNAFRTAT